MRLFALSFLLVQCTLHLASQNFVTRANLSGKLLKNYDQAVERYKVNDYQKARSLFLGVLDREPRCIDAHLKLASLCFETYDLPCAKLHFEKVLELDSNYQVKVYYTLALTEYRSDHFASAKKNMAVFLEKEKLNSDLINKARALYPKLIFADSSSKHLFVKPPQYLASLNSKFSEYLASVRADGNQVFFTRRSPRGDEDLFWSQRTDTGWSEALPLEQINTALNEGSPAISPDGKMLVFTSCDRPGSFGGCDLYYSIWNNGDWSNPINLGDHVNTAAYESQACFADNGQTLYFTSNRKGTLGNNDLWYTHRKSDNSWSIPRNAGRMINTPGNEVCPFVHPNSQYLFFSSDTHPGMGGMDLFYSRIDDKEEWTAPVNLGFPLNTRGDESSLIVFPDGKTAWMASDQKYLHNGLLDTDANLDLYELQLPDALTIPPSTYVQISVLDEESNQAISAEVKILNKQKNEIFFQGNTGEEGSLLVSLPSGSDYALHVIKENYVFEPEQFQCNQRHSALHPMILKKFLKRIASLSNETVELKNLIFESGSAVLKDESRFELDALVKMLKENPEIQLLIAGHTDNVGNVLDNQKLSDRRAYSVVQYLISKDIASDRLEYAGFGESKPLHSNDTEEGRQANRRIEFTIRKDGKKN